MDDEQKHIEGPAGIQGIEGPAGIQGIEGPDGIQGIPGSSGIEGLEGPAGAQGKSGRIGPQGKAGPRGPQGKAGPSGDPAGREKLIDSANNLTDKLASFESEFDLIRAFEDKTNLFSRRSKLITTILFIIICIIGVISMTTLFLFFHVDENTRNIKKVQVAEIRGTEIFCSLYPALNAVYDPEKVNPDKLFEYNKAFKSIRKDYIMLGCKE